MPNILTDADKAKIERLAAKIAAGHAWADKQSPAVKILSILRALPAQVEQEAVGEVKLMRQGGNAGIACYVDWGNDGMPPAGTKLYASPTPAAPAAPDLAQMQKQLVEARSSVDWYKRRIDLLQQWQSRMRDPERTIVCDIIANGSTLPDKDGTRYGAAAPAAPAGMAVPDRAAFERWAASYTTIPVARDDDPALGTTGYTSMELSIAWHAWQAAKTNAPEGAFEGESGANARPGLAAGDSTCSHEFGVQPSSGISLCAKCGLSETATRRCNRAAASPSAQAAPARGAMTEDEINDLARRGGFISQPAKLSRTVHLMIRAILAAHGIGTTAPAGGPQA